MPKDCEHLAKCGFFEKYQNTKNLACRGFIQTYCRGDKMDQCKRKEHRKTTGNPPPDDMMPTGQLMRS